MPKNTPAAVVAPEAPAFSFDQARQLVRAIATANGHPDPDTWAANVFEAYGSVFPNENSLQQETPAV